MTMTDPIADFLTRIRNAQLAGRSEVVVRYSRLKEDIAQVMKKNGFLADFSVQKEENATLKVTLGTKKITLERVSRPGQRIYVRTDSIRKVLNGLGIAIISTPKGVMTGYEARQLNIGGEYLCRVF